MKRKFIITETVNYEVEAETAHKALEEFWNSDNINDFISNIEGREVEAPDPNPVKIGDHVIVDEHAFHREGFDGIVVANDDLINGMIKVKAPDGEIYECMGISVYVPTTVEAEPPEPEPLKVKTGRLVG
jgi:hypothetical protein